MLPTERFFTYVQNNQLFRPSDKVLLTVSGGRDSVFMAHLFNEAKISFGIAHCNFGLRGQESDEDEAFVNGLAKQLNVPFFTTRFETSAFATLNQISIQMAARQLRYQWFEKTREENNYQYIAVAHHQSDATETVLLNLIRGTGIAGLHGILPKRGEIIRPLLFLTRDEINTFIKDEGIRFREDSSNTSEKYARNKIRLSVVPVLKELNKNIDETFAENSRRFAELEDYLDRQVSLLRESMFKEGSNNEQYIPLDELKKLHPRKLLLFELFKPFGFGEAVLSDLAGSWTGQPGKIFQSPTHIILLDRDRLILRERTSRQRTETFISEENEEVIYGRHALRIHPADAATIVLSKDPKFAYFDASLLQFPLKLRLWKKGDYFYPFGMKGKKKLSDFFTGIKLPVFQKEDIPVLENGNGDIIWVAGYRSDNRYKISIRTKKVFILEYLNTHEQ